MAAQYQKVLGDRKDIGFALYTMDSEESDLIGFLKAAQLADGRTPLPAMTLSSRDAAARLYEIFVKECAEEAPAYVLIDADGKVLAKGEKECFEKAASL